MPKAKTALPRYIAVITKLYGDDAEMFRKLMAKKRQSVSDILRQAIREKAEREGVRA